MTKLYAYAVAALLATLAVVGLWVWGQQGHSLARQRAAEAQVIATQRDAAQSALTAFKAQAAKDRAVEAARTRVAQAQAAAAAKQNKELRDALKNNPDWAAARIPDGVRSALRPAPDQAPAAGKPAPGSP